MQSLPCTIIYKKIKPPLKFKDDKQPWYHLGLHCWCHCEPVRTLAWQSPKSTPSFAITGVPGHGSIFTVPAPRPCSVVSCLPLLTNRGSLKALCDVLFSSPLLSIVMVIIAANNRFCQQQFRFFQKAENVCYFSFLVSHSATATALIPPASLPAIIAGSAAGAKPAANPR